MESNLTQHIQQHSSEYDISQRQAEELRIKLSRVSPLETALDKCLHSIDFTIMKELIDELIIVIRCGVGLPTLEGLCRFISSLYLELPIDFLKPYSSQLLHYMKVKVLSTDSVTLTTSYSRACAYSIYIYIYLFIYLYIVCKGVTDNELREYISYILSKMNENENSMCYISIYSLCTILSGKIKDFTSEV